MVLKDNNAGMMSQMGNGLGGLGGLGGGMGDVLKMMGMGGTR
jgi:signal recognition particle subunit SRP54